MLILPLDNISLKKYPNGNIYQGFGENPDDYAPIGYPAGHPGWDIPTFEGDRVRAVCDGVIRFVEDNPTQLGGRSLRLLSKDVMPETGTHIMAAYSHLKQILVKEGQYVNQGEVIGLEGNTGFVISGGTKYWGNAPAGKGVHLHYGILCVNVFEGTPNILNYDNGTKGFVDPAIFHKEKDKQDLTYILLMKIRDLLREILRRKGVEPIA